MTKLHPLLTGLALLFAASHAPAQDIPRDVLLDRILAVVGDDVVMLSELRVETTRMAARLRQRGNQQISPNDSALQKKALDTLVMNKLQLAEAARLGIEIDEETINRAVGAVAANNNLSVAELRAALQAEGIGFDAFRTSMRDEILVRRLRNREVTNRIQVSKSEIDNYLERSGGGGRTAVQLDYIMIPVSEVANDAQRGQARQRATDLVQRLRAGEHFATLAREHSGDSSSATGGNLGWLDIKGIPPLFQPYLAKMSKGDIEGPITSSSGFHIVRLNDVRYGSANIVRQTRARHILIRTDEITSDADARVRLEQLRDRVLHGDDFDTLARANSDDKASAIEGGDLGWSSPGNMVPIFEEQMNQLAENDVSQPFKTEFGWHIVQVLERRDYDASDETRRDQARKAVRDEKAEEALRAYLRRLRDEAYIELRLDDDA